MFRRGAARVSPDPWGLPADDDNYQLDDVQPHPPPPPTLKATAATKDTVPILPSPPQKRQVTPVTSPAIPPPPSPERNNNNVRQNSAVIVVKPVEKPKEEFVYKKNEKHPEIVTSTNKELDQYVDRKFNQNHAWTPYLHERKREMLMKGPVKSSKGFKYSMKSKWNSFKISWREATYSLEVWKGALKKIEVSFNSTTEYVSDLVGNDGQFNDTTNVEDCSSNYSPNVSSDALTLILDFFQGTKKELAASEYNMPLAYFLVTVLVLLFSLIIMVRNTLSNFKETVLAKENSKQGVYCNTVFAAFDYMVDEDEAVKLKQKSIYNGLVADLGDQRHEMEVRNRTRGQKCKVFTVRFLINFLILIMLDPNVADNYHSLVILLVEFLPSIVIGLLNGMYPVIFGILCWETYVGSAVYKLIVFDFIINAAVTIFVEGTRKLITSKCECGLAKSIGPALSALYFTVPPEKPYQASNMNPSPMCGPFRIYDKPSDIIDVQIGNAATWFNTIWTITTSSAVVSAVIILLILMVYYCSALNSAHKDLSDMMKEQLVLEGKDKQFLLARINELGGAPPKKKPPPAQHKKATMQTVNEKQPMRNGDVVMEDMDYRIINLAIDFVDNLRKTENQEVNLYGREKSVISMPANDAPPPADYNYNSNNVTRHEGPSQVSTRNVEVTPTSPQPESKSAMDDW
ncbi:TMC7-like protein [Mya arenaria]|uniref:TMC7-like protein n=1 Tax=Mya arenaria TaxID=6604 RepID=A0ABY7DEI1_MYAAR|nr:TMC7-like protein [Mya arenaria]